jgi:hypothetical protein
MTSLPARRSNRTAIMAGIAAAVVAAIIVIFVVVHAVSGNGTSTTDASLKKTADAMAPALDLRNFKYLNEPTFLRFYQRYVYEEHARFTSVAPTMLPKNQWAQFFITEIKTLPPVPAMITLGKRAQVQVEYNLTEKVSQSGKPKYLTLHAGGKTIRAYLKPMKPPSLFDPGDVEPVLEVFQQL